MMLRSFIRHLLPALAIAGLILAPVARPATAQVVAMQVVAMQVVAMQVAAMQVAAMHAVMSNAMDNIMSGGPAMADHAGHIMAGMPDCPKSVPASDCGKNCPMMALCAAGGFQNVTPAFDLSVPLTLASTFVPGNASGPDGLTQPPLPRPPKI